MTRERLPNRRPNETSTLVFGSMSFAVAIGFFPANDRPGEVFASGAKSGCDLDYLLDDACVALSLLLQHGVQPATLAKSMGRTGDGTTPASIIGALADRLGEIAAQNAPRESTGGPRRASGDGAAPIPATGPNAPGESLTASARAEVA